MGIRTDLALEATQQLTKTTPVEGITKNEYQKANLNITEIIVETDSAAQNLGKPKGKYITIQSELSLENHPDNFNERVDILAEEINKLCDSKENILVIGLGNKSITPDSLGPDVADQTFATRHIKQLAKDVDTSDLSTVSVIKTGVLGDTGIESSETVRAICDMLKPTVIIAIDALACSEISNLGTTIQLCDTGISPGSGVENARKELSEQTLGAKVIAIGVPTVVDMQTISEYVFGTPAPNKEMNNMMVTPRSIDKLIMRVSRLIAMGINRAFQPNLSIEDITSLVE